MGLKRVTAPATYPVTLTEAKAHLRVDDSDNDTMIEMFIKAATGYAESFTGRGFIDQTWDYYLDEFPATGPIRIPMPPLIEVLGVFYDDAAGDEQEVAAADYIVDDSVEPVRITLASSGAWPSTSEDANSVRIRFRAGYLDSSSPPAADVPEEIKAAILLTIGTLFEHRETVVVGKTAVQLPWSAEQLLRMHRVHTAMA